MKKEDSIISPKIKTFLRGQARDCFLRYVTIHTSSNPDSQSCPSTIGQLELAELLKQGLSELELERALFHCDRLASTCWQVRAIVYVVLHGCADEDHCAPLSPFMLYVHKLARRSGRYYACVRVCYACMYILNSLQTNRQCRTWLVWGPALVEQGIHPHPGPEEHRKHVHVSHNC